MRFNNEKLISRVYKTLNTPSYYKDLCMIIIMEEDKCGMEEWKHTMTSFNSIMEFPKARSKLEIQKHKEEPKKLSVERATDLESQHSKGLKNKKMGSK